MHLIIRFFVLLIIFQVLLAQNCPKGFYYDSQISKCAACNQACKECNGPLSQQCTACFFDGILYQGKCFPGCDPSMFFNPDTESCDVCHPACSECNGPTEKDCTNCFPPNTLVNGVCRCQTGQFLNSFGICEVCNTFCQECEGPQANQCLSCSNNMILVNGECKCPLTSAMDLTGKTCQPCVDGCSTCSTLIPAVCQACKNNLVLNGGKCQCPSNLILDTNTYTCLPCSSNCATCSGPGNNQCSSCKGSLQLLPDKSCGCPSNSYINTNTMSCASCDPNCLTCSGPSSNQCLSCRPDQILLNGQCTCPAGTYLDAANRICKQCDSSCGTCVGPLSTDCNSCKSPLVLSGNICGCSNGQYFDTKTSTCLACDVTCGSCTGPSATECSSCPNGFNKIGNECKCPSNSYLNKQTNKCDTCNETCATCSGPSANNCLSCPNGMLFSSLTNTCGCPVGTYWDKLSLTCKACHGSCQTCTGPLDTDCTSCKTGLQKGTNNKCGCSGKTYLDTNTFACQSCDATCGTCSGPNANNCLTCLNGMIFSSSTNTCGCPQGNYWDKTSSSCKPCHGSCQTCTGPLDTDCVSCKTGLQKGTDSKCGCIGNTYLDNTFACQACDATCNTCSGPNSNNCLSCRSDMVFSSSSNTCGCQQSSYWDRTSSSCQACDTTCSACFGASAFNCLSCHSGLIFSSSTNTCGCPAGTYWDRLSLTCKACHGSCQTCTGPLDTDCASCKTGLQKGTNNKCGCSGKTYLDTNTFTCQACDATCGTCSGPNANNCLTCLNDMIFSSSTNTCGCPQGNYWDKTSSSCKPCHGSCQTCTGPLDTDCVSCKTGLQKGTDSKCGCIGNTYLDNTFACQACHTTCNECSGPSELQCISCKNGLIRIDENKCGCPDKTYLDTTNLQCYACNPACNHCSGPSSSDCLACPVDQILLNGVCSSCPTGTYIDKNSLTCQPCHNTCDQCSGPASNQCLSCRNNLLLTSGPQGECGCSKSQYLDSDTLACKSCSPVCNECSGPLSNECKTCLPTWNLVEGKCIQPCSSGQYNTEDGSCSACHPSCNQCSGPGVNDCTSCPPNQVLSQGQCVPLVCDSNCQTCKGPLSSDCTSCSQDHILSDGTCVPSQTSDGPINTSLCPLGLIFVEGLNICLEQCPPSYFIRNRGEDIVCSLKMVIENRIASTKKIDEYSVHFNTEIGSISPELIDLTKVSILFTASNQQPLKYSSSLSVSDDLRSLILKLSIDGHLLPYNTLSVTFNIRDDDNQTSFTLLNKQLTTTLYEYYTYSTTTENAVGTSSAITEVGQRTNEVITYSTSFVLQSIHSIRSELMESMIAYFLFMNIAFPPNFISYALENLNASELFLPNLWSPALDSLEKKDDANEAVDSRLLQEQGTPNALETNLPDTRFLSNVGSSVTFLMLILLLIGISELSIYILKKNDAQKKKIFKVAEYVNFHLRWSYFINEFISEFQGVSFSSLASLILIKNFTPDRVFDFVFSILAFIIVVVSIFAIFFITRWIYLNSRHHQTANLTQDKNTLTLKRLNVLHIEYNKDSFLQLLYPFFLVLRCFGFTLVLAFLQSSPIVQVTYLIVVTSSIIGYIIKMKPFEKKVQQVLCLIYEGLFLAVSIITLALHLYNRSHMEDIETRSYIAFGIIGGGLCMMSLNFVALFFEIVELVKYLRKKSSRVGPSQQATRTETKQPLEETQNSQFTTQFTSSSNIPLKLGAAKISSQDDERQKRIVVAGSSKDISFTDDGTKTDEGTMSINPSLKEIPDKSVDLPMFKFYKYNIKESHQEIKEDPDEGIHEMSHNDYKEVKSPLSSLNKLEGTEEYDEFGSRKDLDRDTSPRERDFESRYIMNSSGSTDQKQKREGKEDSQKEPRRSRSRNKANKNSKTKSKEKKGHRRSIESVAFIFGLKLKEPGSESKPSHKRTRQVMPAPQVSDWSTEMISNNNQTKQTERQEEEQETRGQFSRTIMSARGEEKANPWKTLDLKMAMNSARNHKDFYFARPEQYSDQKDLEDSHSEKIFSEPKESLESLPIEQAEPEAGIDYKVIEQTPPEKEKISRGKLIYKAFNSYMKGLKGKESKLKDEEVSQDNSRSFMGRNLSREFGKSERTSRPLGSRKIELSGEGGEIKKTPVKRRIDGKIQSNGKKE